jgi:Pyruvate/2-oxoacid:ferredoxin oxidoreductase delta subunit
MEIGISVMVGFILGMFFEAWTEPKKKRKPKKRKKNTVRCGSTDLYCFECEMEMSTKEKNGQLFCNNCGLRH